MFKAHRLVYHSTLGWRVIKKRKRIRYRPGADPGGLSQVWWREITRRILKLGAVPIGTVLSLRTTTSQKYAAVPRRARI